MRQFFYCGFGDFMLHGASLDKQIVFLPGLNSDRRVFSPQLAAFPAAQMIEWIDPLPRETLPDYARRLATLPEIKRRSVVVGVSFGGIVALEIARFLDAQCCVIVSSARDPQGLPSSIWPLRLFAGIASPAIVDCVVRTGWPTASIAVPGARRRILRLSNREKNFRKWALQALSAWSPTEPPRCPVFQLHGDRDTQFPAGIETADLVLKGAGHLLALTHSDEVTDFINEAIRKSAANSA